jgi:hypothetical protein
MRVPALLGLGFSVSSPGFYPSEDRMRPITGVEICKSENGERARGGLELLCHDRCDQLRACPMPHLPTLRYRV